jgi:hypothetical protein
VARSIGLVSPPISGAAFITAALTPTPFLAAAYRE